LSLNLLCHEGNDGGFPVIVVGVVRISTAVVLKAAAVVVVVAVLPEMNLPFLSLNLVD
jgi:hypothetical protein